MKRRRAWKITVFLLGLAGFIGALTAVAKNSYDFLEAYWKVKQAFGLGQPSIKEFLLSGRIANVTLDGPGANCSPARVGTMVCGATYRISYRRADGGYIVTGDHVKPRNVITYISTNADPRKSQLAIFDGLMTFDESGGLTHGSYRIGHISLPPEF